MLKPMMVLPSWMPDSNQSVLSLSLLDGRNSLSPRLSWFTSSLNRKSHFANSVHFALTAHTHTTAVSTLYVFPHGLEDKVWQRYVSESGVSDIQLLTHFLPFLSSWQNLSHVWTSFFNITNLEQGMKSLQSALITQGPLAGVSFMTMLQ